MRLVLAMLVVAACGSSEPGRVSVGAATVLRHAMPELAAAYATATGTRIDVVYGASDTLGVRKPDVLVLADATKLASPTPVATTTIVLVGASGAPYRFANLGDAVVAIGDPKTVPVGRYAREYLAKLGVWTTVSPRLVFGGDTLGVLAQAQRGTSHVAIVYATDVEDAAPLVVLDRATDGPTVRIAAAATSTTAGGTKFVTWLATPPAQAILARHGFGPP